MAMTVACAMMFDKMRKEETSVEFESRMFRVRLYDYIRCQTCRVSASRNGVHGYVPCCGVKGGKSGAAFSARRRRQ